MADKSTGPSFLCIGAQKSGTTWLYEMLRHHPDVSFPGGKEVHFWSVHYTKGLDWYKDLFDGPGVTGDITPAYAILPPRKVAELHALNPNVPIIFFIREPVARAWSLARMNVANMQKTLTKLGEGAQIQDFDLNDSWFYRNFTLQQAVDRGRYAQTLRRWWKHFDKSQFLIVRFEDIAASPRTVLQRIAAHIGIDATPFDSMSEAQLGTRVFAGRDLHFKLEYRQFLFQLFRDDVVDLQNMTGMDLSDWLVPPCEE